jgi:hypothetical protein
MPSPAPPFGQADDRKLGNRSVVLYLFWIGRAVIAGRENRRMTEAPMTRVRRRAAREIMTPHHSNGASRFQPARPEFYAEVMYGT